MLAFALPELFLTYVVTPRAMYGAKANETPAAVTGVFAGSKTLMKMQL